MTIFGARFELNKAQGGKGLGYSIAWLSCFRFLNFHSLKISIL